MIPYSYVSSLITFHNYLSLNKIKCLTRFFLTPQYRNSGSEMLTINTKIVSRTFLNTLEFLQFPRDRLKFTFRRAMQIFLMLNKHSNLSQEKCQKLRNLLSESSTNDKASNSLAFGPDISSILHQLIKNTAQFKFHKKELLFLMY